MVDGHFTPVWWIPFGFPRKRWIPFITYAWFPRKKVSSYILILCLPFGQDCPKSCFSEISSKCYYFVLFNFAYNKYVQSFGFLACLDGHLQVLGLTQPTVLTLEWIRGLSLVSPSAFVVNLLLTIPQSIPSGTFSLKWQITCKITVFTV